jgi:hypothetical protein
MAAIPDPWKTLKGGATAGEDAGRRQRLSASSRDEKLRRGKRADFSSLGGSRKLRTRRRNSSDAADSFGSR